MDTYQIEWKRSALRELRQVDHQAVVRIVSSVESLSSAPFPSGVRKLHGSRHTYRIRVGDYRVIYEVVQSHLLVQILRVRHRKDAYRK